MNHSVIKSASIYSAKLPAIAAMREHLAELSFTPLTENQLSCAGFENNLVTGELVTNLPGVGYAFVVRQDTKLIPTKIVNRKLKERVDALITSGLREKVTRKEKQAMKEQLIVEMASTAEYETTLVHALYDQNNELLYLNTTTKRPLKVSTSIGPMWVIQRNTRQCSGVDGRCMCAGEDLAARGDAERRARGETGRGGACCVPPPGNTGGTMVTGEVIS